MSKAEPKFNQLVEDVDFYKEGEKVVFTSVYHLKRGYCCNSKCRHCPYGLGVPSAVRIDIQGLSRVLPIVQPITLPIPEDEGGAESRALSMNASSASSASSFSDRSGTNEVDG